MHGQQSIKDISMVDTNSQKGGRMWSSHKSFFTS